MADIQLSCECGAVKGAIDGKAVKSGNRLICCCDDCQGFAAFLGRESDVLDQHGGTDIFQTSPSSLKIVQGKELIRCARRSAKGTNRWYTECCKTPIGNTLGPNLPFVGIIHSFIADKDRLGEMIGPPSDCVQTLHAKNWPDDAPKPVAFPKSVTFKIMLKILTWKILGKGKPNPLFDEAGRPISKPRLMAEPGS